MKLGIIILILLLVAVGIYLLVYANPAKKQNNPPTTQPLASTTPKPTLSKKPSPAIVNPLINAKTGLYYPLPDFASRISLNPFGRHFSSSSTPRSDYPDRVCPNNTLYNGYHTASDLEVSQSEDTKQVPVYAIAGGTVRFAESARGYGGLIIIRFNYHWQSYMAIYGHIDIRTLRVKFGKEVKAGQILANLAPPCSIYSGNNRKHLHFGIHKGQSLDTRGYVPTSGQLNQWLDPKLLYTK